MLDKPPLIIYWARRDLRLVDNPALSMAISQSKAEAIAFAPIFILEDYMLKADPISQFGYPQREFLARALPEFIQQFPVFHLIQSKVVSVFYTLAEQYALEIYVNQDIYPDFTKQIDKIRALQIPIHIFQDRVSVNLETTTQTGNLYSVFTPFKKAVWEEFLSLNTLPKANLEGIIWADTYLTQGLDYLSADEKSLKKVFSQDRLMLAGGKLYNLEAYLAPPKLEIWYSNEAEAQALFRAYLESGLLEQYKANRDSLELDTQEQMYQGLSLRGKTSRMSLALAWGLVSAGYLRSLIQEYYQESFIPALYQKLVDSGPVSYLSELIWREFYGYLLYHHPELLTTEFQPKFRQNITWIWGEIAHQRLQAWVQGKTGYPIVDAAMQQLAQTGWMHNRARMIVASILTKNLGIDWRWGQEYFRASLIDLDEASNNGGWQWAASVGADPKPIRIFNPYTQAQNYDPKGLYQQKWLGSDYITPLPPIVEHQQGRAEALSRYHLTKVKLRDY